MRLVPGARRYRQSIKSASCARFVEQDRRRRESTRKTSIQVLQLIYDPLGSNAVDVPERSAPERREPDPEHGADVPVAGRPEDLLLETAGRFVHHREHTALYDLFTVNLAALAADDVVDVQVDVASLARLVVPIEALSTLPPLSLGGDDKAHRFRRRHPFAERFGQHEPNLAADVDSDFVEQGDRAHREPEVD